MQIRCESCGHTQEVNKELILKIIGGSVSGFGIWAWTSFFFAGTGFAMPICIAIVIGGTGIAAYSKEVIEWLIKKGYSCPKCNNKKWVAILNEEKSKPAEKIIKKPEHSKVENATTYLYLLKYFALKYDQNWTTEKIELIKKFCKENYLVVSDRDFSILLATNSVKGQYLHSLLPEFLATNPSKTNKENLYSACTKLLIKTCNSQEYREKDLMYFGSKLGLSNSFCRDVMWNPI